MKVHPGLCLPVLLLLTGTVREVVAGPAYTILSATNGYGTNYSPQTFGDIFTPDSDITVTALGFLDLNHTGLGEGHEIGIFSNSSQGLVASTTVPSGTSAALIGDFRYVSIAPVVLHQGDAYTLAATLSANDDAVGYTTVAGVQLDSRISTDSSPSRYALSGPGLFFPDQTAGRSGDFYIGPNFEIASSSPAVPEPGSIALLAIGGVGLALFRRRKTRQRTVSEISSRSRSANGPSLR